MIMKYSNHQKALMIGRAVISVEHLDPANPSKLWHPSACTFQELWEEREKTDKG